MNRELTNQLTISSFVSRLFEPMLVLTVLTISGALHSGLQGPALRNFLFLFFGGLTLPVTIFRYWLVRSGRVGNWDISNRRERVKPLLALVIFTIIDLYIISKFANSQLVNLFTIYLIWILGFFLITLRFKVSGHVGVITLAVGLIIRWYGLTYLPLLLTIPLIAWARVTGKNHTLREVVLGIIYSFIVLQLV